MKKRMVKAIARGTIIFFAGIGVGQTFTLIKDTSKTSIIEFNTEKKQGPSATNSPKIEGIGKKVDEILGNTESWNNTSGIDTYGEALAGTLDAFLTGKYKSQKPTSEELINFINEDMNEVRYNLDLVFENDNLSYFENLDKIATIYFQGNYEKSKIKKASKIMLDNYKFILEKDIYKGRNIIFEEMDYKTKLYFINSVLDMDKMLTAMYPDYKEEFENDLYLNLRQVLIEIGTYVMDNNKGDLLKYKNKIINKYSTKLK